MTGPPLVWLLLGTKAGDNNQIFALADALGWPAEQKRIRCRPWELATNILLRVTLAGISKGVSSSLEEPWPDLVLTAGRRNEPVARWIREQSGGRTRLVHMGRPWVSPSVFDLVVTTPQYDVVAGPTVLVNELPLHRLTQERLKVAAAVWMPQFAHLKRPWVVLLLGGNSGRYVMTRRKLRRLGRAVAEMTTNMMGSLLVTDSARTPVGGFDHLARGFGDVPHYAYRWSPGDSENPYFGFLALADEIIVTGESVSMLAEAVWTGKPVHVFDPGVHPVALSGELPDTRPWYLMRDGWRWKSISHRVANTFGPRRMRRDVGAIQHSLIAAGRAAWLGDPAPKGQPGTSLDVDRSVARVRALLG